MSIITRYILKEHVGPFIYGVMTITLLFLLNLVFRDLGRLLGKGLSAWVIIEFFALNLAWILAIAVPMGLLVATLMAFGRLSADSEIAALKASGVHLYRLFAPLLAVSFVMMIGMERFHNCILPDLNHRVRVLARDISRTRPTLSMEPHVFFDDIDDYSLLVHEIDDETNRISGVIIDDHSDRKYNKTIIAESGEMAFSSEQEMMVLTLYNGEVHEVELSDLRNYRRLKFEQQVLSIPVPNMVLKRSETQNRGDREKSAAMMREDIKEDQEQIRVREDRIRELVKTNFGDVFPVAVWTEGGAVAPSTNRMVRGRVRGVERIHQQIQSLNRVVTGYQRSINSHLVEIHKKYSLSVACIVFVLVGVPLGIMARQGGMAVAGGFSLVFYLVYWVFFIEGEQLADRNLVEPAPAMWAPNVLVGICGVYLIFRTVRETTFIRWEEWGRWFRRFSRKERSA